MRPGPPVKRLERRLPVWTELSRQKGHGCSRPSPGKVQRPRRGQGTSEGSRGGPLSDPEPPLRLRLRRWPCPGSPRSRCPRPLPPNRGPPPMRTPRRTGNRAQVPRERRVRPRGAGRGWAGPGTRGGHQAWDPGQHPPGCSSPQGLPVSADRAAPGPGRQQHRPWVSPEQDVSASGIPAGLPGQ